MRDRANTIIYIGKAKYLDHRVPTYFRSLRGQHPKVWRMVDRVYDFEYILTSTELEALILESQLVKKHQPQYNIRLKDDKAYPFIKVTVGEAWPRVIPTRRVLQDGARYFGPFRGMGNVHKTLSILERLFPFRTCDKEITGNDKRPCMEYFIHRCLGPCASLAEKSAYDEAIGQVVMFLEGKHSKIIRQLTKQMEAASENLAFERAAVLRDRIKELHDLSEQQIVFNTTQTDQDVIAFARNDGEAVVQVFFIREGKVLGREHHVLEGTAESEPAEILESFISQFYDELQNVPSSLVLQHEINDADIIESWLRERRGTKVAISVPRRGQKRDLVEMAARNAAETLEQLRIQWLSDEQKATAALTELQAALGLTVWPQRIECYDVAHLQGTDTAGAMVVFEQGVPKKKEYRRFQIRTSGNNDYASMQEMLSRRFKRSAAEHAANERVGALARARAGERDEPAPGDDFEALVRLQQEGHEVVPNGRASNDGANWNSWAVLPDLVVIDGGKGQLSAAQEVMRQAGLLDVPMIGLAKRDEEVFMPGRSDPVILPRPSEALHLLQRVRDEAHRFSNSYNKKLGSKRATKSKLDMIPGIGPKRKKALMRRFGSVKAIRQASVEELMAVDGMDRTAVQKLKENL
jgi:excinuclease ABC subunit C